MRLARVLQWRSVDEMLDNLSYAELKDWEAFYSIEPFPEVIDRYENARLLTLLANSNRDPEKRSTPFEVDELVLDFWKEPKEVAPMTGAEIYSMAQTINAAFGGKIVKRSETVQ